MENSSNESKTDNGKQGTNTCENCKVLRGKLRDQENLYYEIFKDYHKHSEETGNEMRTLQERSMEYDALTSRVLGNSADLECLSDPFRPQNIARRFESVHNHKWFDLCERLSEEYPDVKELQRLKFVSDLVKQTFLCCQAFGEEQMRIFLVKSMDETVPRERSLLKQITDDTPEDTKRKADLLEKAYSIRRQNGQTDRARNHVKEKICKQVFENLETAEVKGNFHHFQSLPIDIRREIGDFITEVADCCWLMTISNPKLVLNFEAEDREYSGKIKDRFVEFSSDEPIVVPGKAQGTIVGIAWPSVELELGEVIFQKGEVITAAVDSPV